MKHLTFSDAIAWALLTAIVIGFLIGACLIITLVTP